VDYESFSLNFDVMERLAEFHRQGTIKSNQQAELQDLSLLFATMPIEEIEGHLKRKTEQLRFSLSNSEKSLKEIISSRD
jgi:hypothetical protein